MAHLNSLLAYNEEFQKLSKRAKLIYAEVMQSGEELTDREIRDRFYSTKELAFVQPRISDLHEERWFKQTGTKKCEVTGKTVRVSKAQTAEERSDIQTRMAI